MSRNLAPVQLPDFASSDQGVEPFGTSPIIVHCHLRWDFVWQRPQQILSRLATHHSILFLEDPIDGKGPIRIELSEVFPEIMRAVPIVPGCHGMSIDQQCAAVLPLLRQSLKEERLLAGRFERPVQWFYSPMTAPAYLGQFDEAAIVYDCMDELSNFRFAPPDLSQREAFLLSQADVVFTGGFKLYETKSKYHANTHFYGCGVDLDHFGKARAATTVPPPDIGGLSAPILGYFGVIDERLDYALIAELAQAFPAGSVVMVGPLAKVEARSLPQSPNIHWMGQRAYSDLPAIVKAFDVCLMPFAMNESTRYINPTKTLEYMAAGKPIVSTAVPDVVRHFTPVVQVASSSRQFVDLVANALNDPNAPLLREGIECARAASWDAIVTSMRGDMCRAIGSSACSVPVSTTASEDAHTLSNMIAQAHPSVQSAPFQGVAVAMTVEGVTSDA